MSSAANNNNKTQNMKQTERNEGVTSTSSMYSSSALVGGGRPPVVQSRQTTISSVDGGSSQLAGESCFGNKSRRISLRDLVDHNPLESEADTYIQSTLEEVDHTSWSLPQTTILGNVPKEVTRDAFLPESNADDDSDDDNSNNHTAHDMKSDSGSRRVSLPQAPPSLSRRAVASARTLPLYHQAPQQQKQQKQKNTTTTAEDLWQLTRDMQQMAHRPDLSSSSDSDADNTLVHNAVRIWRRNQGSSASNINNNNVENTETTTTTTTSTNAADRWKKLRHSVHAGANTKANNTNGNNNKNKNDATAGATANPKKTDVTDTPDVTEEVDVEQGDGDTRQHNIWQSDDQDQSENDHNNNNYKPDSSKQDPRLYITQNDKAQQSHGSIITNRAITEYKDFEAWIQFKKGKMLLHIKVVLGLMIVATGIAAILFYLVGNPPCHNSSSLYCGAPAAVLEQPTNTPNSTTTTATTTTTASMSESRSYFMRASASWWLLFLCCRQAVTLTLARVTEAAIIDYFALRSKMCVRLFGPFVTLFIVQSRGWPFLLFSWGMYDFILLYGENQFAQHWLFWQNPIGLFNEQNPSGNVPSSSEYEIILILAVVVSFVVSVKRFWLGLRQGRGTYLRYGDELANIMKKSLLIGRVAALGRDIEVSKLRIEDFTLHVGEEDLLFEGSELDNFAETGSTSLDEKQLQQHSPRKNLRSGVDTSSRRARLDELLGAWEEPDAKKDTHGDVTIASIIQFRQSLACLNDSFPFGGSFGPASTRKECVESAEAVYYRLMLCTPSRTCLTFDVLARLAVSADGGLDEEKLKALIKLFRPDREGNLTLLDFAKSVDSVYKELRLLRANVANSTKLDKAFEAMFNVFFYALLTCIVLAAIGIDPLVLFASISGFILGFAFMIGAACSKYFEGLLLIFVRRPYDIGDRIAISNPFTDTLSSGSPAWVVKDIDLYTTTVVYGSTNEVATIANGSLAALRIINCARSPKASLSFLLKFPIDTSYSKLQVFKSSVEKFIKARPREWVSFSAFRATRVEADLGFVEYTVNAQHRESWQNVGALLESKAQLSSFALELSKKMGMRYIAPPMPIDLNLKQKEDDLKNLFELQVPAASETMERERSATEDFRSFDVADSVAAMFGTKLSSTKLE